MDTEHRRGRRGSLSDLAVVRVHNAGAPAAPLGNADDLKIGQLVVAVGNPTGKAGVYLGDVIISAGAQPTQTVQALQRLMLGPAIGTELPMTLLRKNALVDVVTVPAELS